MPTQLLDNPTWKTYLSARYTLTRQLGDEVRNLATKDPATPRWAEAPATAADPALPQLAARLAATARRHPDLARFLAEAAGQGPLPDDHPADALHYRVTALVKQADNMARHEALSIGRAHRPNPQRPRSMHGPDRSRGISI